MAVGKEVRAVANARAGDIVRVVTEHGRAERTVDVPAELVPHGIRRVDCLC
jgi:hypothetical protein